jgi:N-acetyl sugar amidotransferase
MKDQGIVLDLPSKVSGYAGEEDFSIVSLAAQGMKMCNRCMVLETQDGIEFDHEGICTVCRQVEVKETKIDWNERRRQFEEILSNYRGKYSYDCVVPFSGGKDSTFTLWKLVTDFKLKPLVVTFDHGFFRPKHLAARARTLKTLGVDHISFTANWHVVKKLMRESLIRKGDFCWHCHTGVYAFPMQLAVRFEVPLIIWGQPTAEYGSYGYDFENIEEVDERMFNRFINLGITAQDMVGMLDEDVTERDLMPFTYPSLRDLKRIKYRSVCLGSFIPWDTLENSRQIREALGWGGDLVEGVPPQFYWEKVECMFTGVRDYLKFIKRGFGRTRHLTSIEIREGRMNRDEAARLVAEYDGRRPASLDLFLKNLEMAEESFMDIALSHQVSPYRHDASKVVMGPKLWDQDLWNRIP